MRVIHIPLVRSACRWQSTTGVPAAVLIGIELHAGRVAGNHSTSSIDGQFRRTHIIDIKETLGAVAPIFVRVLLGVVIGHHMDCHWQIEAINKRNIEVVLVICIECKLCQGHRWSSSSWDIVS